MKNVLLIMFASMPIVLLAKAHKFSPELQAIYDAATAPEVQEAQRKGARAKLIYHVVDDAGNPITNMQLLAHGRMTIRERRGTKLLSQMLMESLSLKRKLVGDSVSMSRRMDIICLPLVWISIVD